MPARTDKTLAELATVAERLADLAARQDLLVGRARHAGATWVQVAEALGVTVQAAHKRYRHLRYDPVKGTVWREHQLRM